MSTEEDLDALYPETSNFLSAQTLDPDPRQLTISELKISEIGKRDQEKEKKGVILFEGTKDCLVLNQTNYEILKEAYGTSQKWIGKKIELYTEMVNFGKKRVKGIRVRAL